MNEELDLEIVELGDAKEETKGFPIKADFVGKNVPTALDEKISLLLTESGAAQDEALLLKK